MTTGDEFTSRSTTDVVQEIHQKVDEALSSVAQLAGDEPLDGYLRRIGEGYGGPHQELLQTYDVVIAELSRHLMGMEVAVSPEVIRRCSDGRRLVRSHLLRARQMQATVRNIDQLLWGDAQAPSRRLDTLHHRLLELMAAHRDEEVQMLQLLDATLTPQERAALAVRLERGTARAPSRPHAHALLRPAWSRLVYRPVAAWDRFLDMLDSRVAPATAKREPRTQGLWTSYLLGRQLPAQRSSGEATPTSPPTSPAGTPKP